MNTNPKQTLIATFSVLAVLALAGGCGGGGGSGGGNSPTPSPEMTLNPMVMVTMDPAITYNSERLMDIDGDGNALGEDLISTKTLDPDGTGDYDAESSDDDVATANVEEVAGIDMVRVTPRGVGRATITISAVSLTPGAGANSLAPRETGGEERVILTYVVEVEELIRDLAIFAEPTLVEDSSDLTLSVVVHNNGNRDASEDATITYYGSTDSTINSSDTPIGTTVTVQKADLEAATAFTAPSVTATTPTIPDIYYYGACIDTITGESDTTNNCSAGVELEVTGSSLADLLTISVSSPDKPGEVVVSPGNTFTLTYTVENTSSTTNITDDIETGIYMGTLPFEPTSDTPTEVSGTVMTISGGLDVGDSSGTFSHEITVSTTPGLYYYDPCVEIVTSPDDEVCTQDSIVSVRGAGNPELIAHTPTASLATVAAGDDITLSVVVENVGDMPTTEDITVTYFYDNRWFSRTRTPVGGQNTISRGLPAGDESAAQSITVTVPSTPGTYFFGGEASRVTGETNTADNISYGVEVEVTAPEPDLEFSATPMVSLPASQTTVNAGDQFTLSIAVHNNGNGATTETALITYYRSDDSTITSFDTREGTDTITGGISADATSTQTISVIAPTAGGTYYYGACVATVTGETVTDNNCSTGVAVTVNARPDLVISTTPTVSPSTVDVGGNLTLRVTVRNNGADETTEDITVTYYRSTNSTITSFDTPEGTDTISNGIAEGTNAPVQDIALTAPTTGGTYYYGACVATVTGEFDITNNCSTGVEVTVRGPDLVIPAAPMASSQVEPGGAFSMDVVVRNAGDGATTEPATITYYQSTDSTIDISDTPLTTSTVTSGLGAISDAPIDTTIVPAPTTAGIYYYGACVSTVTGESDTTNNCSDSVAVTVANSNMVVSGVSISSMDDGVDVEPGLVAGFHELEVVTHPSINFTLAYTVTNLVATAEISTEVDWALLPYEDDESYTTVFTDDRVDGPRVDGLFDANTDHNFSTIITAPDVEGSYGYAICAYSVEGDQDCQDILLTVIGIGTPELVAFDAEVSPTTVAAGDDIELSVLVENIGDIDTTEDIIVTYFYNNGIFTSRTRTTVGGQNTIASGLDSGEESDRQSITVEVPSTLTPGLYVFGGCASTVTGETNISDNCSLMGAEVRVTPATPRPDLVISDAPTAFLSPVNVFGNLTLGVVVSNDGNGGTTDDLVLTYYRSTDAAINSLDTSVGTAIITGGLAANDDSPTETIPLIEPAGTHYYGACVATVTDESDTTNNCSDGVAVTVPTEPDLVVIAVPTVSTSGLYSGDDFLMSVVVHNIGSSATTATATINYYSNRDVANHREDTLVATGGEVSSGLEANAYFDDSVRVTTRSSDAYDAHYFACVTTDPDESNTANNCSPRVFVFRARELRFVTAITAPASTSTLPLEVSPGESFAVSYKVENLGPGAVGGIEVGIEFTDNIRFSETSFLGSVPGTDTTIPGLAEGGTFTREINIAAPNTAGIYYYGVCAETVALASDGDPLNSDCGGDYDGNNSLGDTVLAVRVGPPTPFNPALTYSAEVVSPPITPSGFVVSPGGTFTLGYTVQNAGDTVVSADTEVVVYMAANTGAATEVIGTVNTISELAVGEVRRFSLDIIAPDRVGSYSYIPCQRIAIFPDPEDSTPGDTCEQVMITVE